jgi:hypothetical protein
MPSSSLTSLPYAPLLRKAERHDDDDDNPRGSNDVHDVQTSPPNTQQPAVGGGGGDYNGNWDGDGSGDGDSNSNNDGDGDSDGDWQG